MQPCFVKNHISFTALVHSIVAFAAASPVVHAQSVPAPTNNQIVNVKARRVQIEFTVREEALPISSVEVYATTDMSRTWSRARVESGVTAPAVCALEQDGLYGLYLVVRNKIAASVPPPQAGTQPHLWVYVDATHPAVQIHDAARSDQFKQDRKVNLRYSAHDSGLTDRPICVDYAADGTQQYFPIAGSLDNAGQFSWTVPQSVSGRVRLRVLAEDRVGNIGSAISTVIDLDERPVIDIRAESDTTGDVRLTAAESDDMITASPLPLDDDGTSRDPDDLIDLVTRNAVENDTGDLFNQRLHRARWHMERREWTLAEARFNEALQQNPTHLSARNGLAGVLYRQGRLSDATKEYRQVLKQQPYEMTAMAGLALIRARQRDYRGARDILEELAARNDDNPEIWMNLGDMRALCGDSAAARQAWDHASQSKKATPRLIARIQRRMVVVGSNSAP